MIYKTIVIPFIFVCIGLMGETRYAETNYYLIDSLDVNKLSYNDSLLLDSSLALFHKTNNDSIKAAAILHIVEASWNESIYPKYNAWLLQFVEKSALKESNPYGFKWFLLNCKNNNASLLRKQSKYQQALIIFEEALDLSRSIKHKESESVILNNIGNLYLSQGIQLKAIDYFSKSLSVSMEINYLPGQAICHNNLGYIYDKQEQFDEAYDSYLKSLAIYEELDHKKGMAMTYNNLGYNIKHNGLKKCNDNYSCQKKQLKKALYYYSKSLEIRELLGSKKGIALAYNNIGTILSQYGDTTCIGEPDCKTKGKQLALAYFLKGYEIREELNDFNGMANSLSNVATIYLETGDLKKCDYYAQKSMNYAQKSQNPFRLRSVYELLYRLNKELGNPKLAIEHYENYIAINDSLLNENNQKAAIRQQTKYEFEKAQLVAEQRRNEEFRIQNEKLERRNNLQYSVIFIAILAVFGLVLALGKISVSAKVAEGLIFFAFLLFFEFLLVLSDPYVDNLTNGEPMYKLLANALLAGLIFPLHAFFERILKVRLIKNSTK